MNKLTVGKTVQINFTANDWSLYTGDDYPNAARVARTINRELMDAVHSGWSRRDVERHMLHFLSTNERVTHGGADTAVREVLAYVLDEIYRGADPDSGAIERGLTTRAEEFESVTQEQSYYSQVKKMIQGVTPVNRSLIVVSALLALDNIAAMPTCNEATRQICLRLRAQINELL